MPEGPSIVIVTEALAHLERQRVTTVAGNAKIDLPRLMGQRLEFVLSWGKHLILSFETFFIRIHFLMWGSWRLNERKNASPRLSLVFGEEEVNFYSCSIRLVEGSPVAEYDWRTDVMSPYWEGAYVLKKVQMLPAKSLVTDVILDQELFSGAGNIIKNEVLWRIRLHPESTIGKLSVVQIRRLVKDVREYSLLFYEWKKQFVLKKNWKIYKKSLCPRCNLKTSRGYCGSTERLTCYCMNCQILFN